MFLLGCCVDVENLEIVCKAGYEFIDLSGKQLAEMPIRQVEAIKEMLQKYGVPCMGLHATFPASVAICGRRYDETAYDDYIEKLAERVTILGAKYIGVGSPYSRNLEDGISKEAAENQLIKCLEKLCDKLPDSMILLESLNCEETNFINTMPEAYDIIKKVTKKNIGLVWDIYHFAKMKESIKDLSSELLKKVNYIHIADEKERAFPLEKTEEAFFTLLKNALKLTEVQEVAIEALSTSIEKDIKKSRKVIFSRIL